MRVFTLVLIIALFLTNGRTAVAATTKQLDILYELGKAAVGSVIEFAVGRGLEAAFPISDPHPNPNPPQVETVTPWPVRLPQSSPAPRVSTFDSLIANFSCSPPTIDSIDEEQRIYEKGVDFYLGRPDRAPAITQNKRRAVECFSIGADHNYAPSQRFLGYMYLHSEGGLARSEGTFFALTHKAAISGDAGAEFNLGSAYCYGYGAEKNLDRCAYWWERAQEAGDPSAPKFLAKLRELGWNP